MARVVVIGSSNTDLMVRLPRLPQPGETLLGGTFQSGPGGKGANQAVAARRAGAEVVFITAVGADDFGRQALEHFRREGLDLSFTKVVEGEASGVAVIFIAEDGENSIGVASGANARLTSDEIDQLPAALFDPASVLLVGLEVPLPTAVRAIERAASAGQPVILNPAPAVPNLLRSLPPGAVRAVTPNRLEASLLFGPASEISETARLALRALQDRRIGSAVVTLGAEGCLALADGVATRVPAPRVEAVDTVGAGDAFNGALAAALAERRPFLEAVAWASAAAALAVTQPGAQSALPRRQDIDRLASTTYGEHLQNGFERIL